MSRSRILIIVAALAAVGWLGASITRVPADQIAVRDSVIPGMEPAVVPAGWRIIPRGLYSLTRYPAGPVSFAFGEDEPLALVTPEGSKVTGAGKLQYRIDPAGAAALHARCGGRLDDWMLGQIRSALTRVVSEPGFSPLTASKLPEAEAAGQKLLEDAAGGAGLRIESMRLDRLGYEGTASATHPHATVRRKLIWFAVDSFDWNIARPLIDAGHMPNLKRLMEQGAWGNLQTIVPILSPVVWTSAATGKRPEKHGIIDFVAADPRTGALAPITSSRRKVRALWNMLSDGGVSVGVVAWWASFPAETVDGYIATDRIAYQLFQDQVKKKVSSDDPFKTYPADLYPKIAPLIEAPAAVSDKALSRFIDVGRYSSRFSPDDEERVHDFTTALAASHTYTAIAMRLFAERPTDFRAVYFEGPDEASHLFMPFVPPPVKTVDASKAAWFGGVVREYYIYQDELIGKFLDAFDDDDTTVLLSSDHGFKIGADRPETESRVSHGKAADWHSSDGMIVLAGKDIPKGVRILNASVLDIVPTILCLYGMPVGEDMDGKPLTMALSPEFLAAHQPTQVATYETGTAAPAPVLDYASEEGQEAIEKLRSLGYIEQAQPSALFNQGAAYMQVGEYDKAIARFQAALKKLDDADVRLALARAYRLSRRYDQAAEQLDELVKGGWKGARVYIEMSMVRRDLKDYEGAERLLKLALESEPDSTEAQLNLGRLYAGEGRWDDALASFRRASELDPNSGETYNQIGVVLKKLGRTDEAIAALRQAIKVAPDTTGPYNNLGIIYRETGKMGKALEVLKLGTTMAPKSAMLRNSLASLYFAQGDAGQAVEELEAAVAADPNHVQTLSNLVSISMAQHDSARAEKYIRRLMELEPGNTDLSLSLAAVLSDQKRFDESRRILHDLLARNPRDPQALMILGEAEFASGNLAEAARSLEQSGEIDAKNPRVWNGLARCYLAMGRKDDARQAMRRSLDADPKQPEVGRKLAEMGG